MAREKKRVPNGTRGRYFQSTFPHPEVRSHLCLQLRPGVRAGGKRGRFFLSSIFYHFFCLLSSTVLDPHGSPPPRDPDKVATAGPRGHETKAEVTLQKAAAPSRSAASMRPPPPCSSARMRESKPALISTVLVSAGWVIRAKL